MRDSEQFAFCPSLKQLLETRQTTGRTGKTFNGLAALSTENNLLLLRQLAQDAKVESTLEIGLAFGASCLALAATHRDLGNSPQHQHIAIDPFQSTVWDDAAKVVLEQANLDKYVELHEEFSHFVLPKLLAEGRKFDLIYVDGSHLFEDVFIDFFYSDKLLNQQGIILFDDSSDPHIRKVLDFINSNFGQFYQKLDLSQSRSGLKKLKSVAANVLKKNQLTAYRKTTKTNRPWDAPFKSF